VTSEEEFWLRFNEIDRRRREHSCDLGYALKALDPGKVSATDPESIAAWRRYCESVASLEASLVELERLMWRL
jgi:hypothetical protein